MKKLIIAVCLLMSIKVSAQIGFNKYAVLKSTKGTFYWRTGITKYGKVTDANYNIIIEAHRIILTGPDKAVYEIADKTGDTREDGLHIEKWTCYDNDKMCLIRLYSTQLFAYMEIYYYCDNSTRLYKMQTNLNL